MAKRERREGKKCRKWIRNVKCSFHSVLSASFFSSSLCSYWLLLLLLRNILSQYANCMQIPLPTVPLSLRLWAFSLSSLLCLQSRCDPNSYHRNYCVKFEVCKDEWHRIILCRWIWFSGRILHFNSHTHSLSSSRVWFCCVLLMMLDFWLD